MERDAWERGLLEHMDHQSNPEDDPYAYAHDQAFLEFYKKNSEFRDLVLGVGSGLESRPEQAAFKLQKSAQAIELWRAKQDKDDGKNNDFPHGFDQVPAWLQSYERLMEDSLSSMLYVGQLKIPIASNVSERAKLFKATALLHGRPGPITILDVGSSLNHGLRRLAEQDPTTPEGRALNYNPVDIYVRDKTGRQQSDLERTKIFQRLINRRRLRLGPSLGIDVYDAERDEPYIAWAESNSFRMPELLDPTINGIFKYLKEARPENVSFRRVDAASIGEQGKIKERFEMVMISTMLYLLRESDRRAVIQNAHHWVDQEKGLIAILDFVDIGPRGGMHFYPKRDWRWNYKLWVKDMAKPENGFRHYFTAEDGRACKLILEQAIGELAVAREIGLAPEESSKESLRTA
jgi:hypothetical protein